MAGARHGMCALTRHGMGTAWVQHDMRELAFTLPEVFVVFLNHSNQVPE
jgi:hypothetical protein